jgi:N6-L-threonylcarbamoyladenine synthase
VIGGGVAANRELRRILAERAPDDLSVHVPSPSLCVDNGAMVAIRGAQLLAMGRRDELDLDVVATGRR